MLASGAEWVDTADDGTPLLIALLVAPADSRTPKRASSSLRRALSWTMVALALSSSPCRDVTCMRLRPRDSCAAMRF
mgnify:CR=1 FL=1